MKKTSHAHHSKLLPLLTLTQQDEQQHLAQRFGGRGEIEVIGLLGLAALIISLHLLYLLS